MDRSAIEKWLIKEFSKRFQYKSSEYLTTLIWFDPDRYWLLSIPWLLEKSANWTVSLKGGNSVPMKLIAVGSDVPDGKGQSPLQVRVSILSDRVHNMRQDGIIDWGKVSRWIIYYPYPVDWLNEATRPKKSIPMSWLMPFCEAGLDWGRRGGDEDKLPAFLRSHDVDITKDKKQLVELYNLNESDRSASPLSRLVAQNLDKPVEFWKGKSWDLNTVQSELVGDLGRQMEELLVDPQATITRLVENGVLKDFINRLESHLGGEWSDDEVMANPAGFSRGLVRHVALCTTWKLTDYDPAFPFSQELPPQYKIDHCQSTIEGWLKIPEVGKAYVDKCRDLEKEGLNLIGTVDVDKYGHVFPHIILYQWQEAKKKLEDALGTSLKNIRSVLQDIKVREYDKVWDQLMPGELGWYWLSLLKEIEKRAVDGESWLAEAELNDLKECILAFSDPGDGWWKIDEIARRLMVLAVDDPDGDLIKALLLPLYNHWLKVSGECFTKILINNPDLKSMEKIPHVAKTAKSVWSFPEGNRRKAIIITDALRYDLAMEVCDRLKRAGFKVHVEPWIADLPSKTEVGMTQLLPDCDRRIEINKNKIFVTHDGKNFGIKNNRIEFLKEKFGNDLASIDMKGLNKASLKAIKSKILTIFSRDIDAEGEAKGIGLFKDIEKEMAEITQKVRLLARNRFQEIHIITDHGFLLSSSDGMIKWGNPQSSNICERRFAVIPKNIGTDLPVIPSPWDDDHWLALPPARTVFSAGGQTEYLHGGASLQEVVVPHVKAEVQERAVRVRLTMFVDKEFIDSGIVKIVLKGESPVEQLPLPFMPTVELPRSGYLVAERKGKAVSNPKNFELWVGDELKLTLFLDRGLKQDDKIDIIAKDGEELLSTKTLKVIRDV
ncbi:MAG: PglZ domain-containing protein [Deltaproteobacteria bacterium]|nr:PglZ domain-containing protein [Deltaproteobacteria bacterium]MBW2153250.1 PglZ domain-containing protein [Deltaproteobacteria bacterium]